MKRTFTFSLLLFLCFSCRKEKDCPKPEGIRGEWQWVESVGGIGGWTLTPESEKISKTLRIDDFTYREFVNDSLVYESEYDLEIRKDTFWDTDRYIIFKDGDERAIKITASTLELYELCFDCFFHKYKRK